MRTLTIAAIQTAPPSYDLEAAWRQFRDQVLAVRDLVPHVQLVVVPELMLAAEGGPLLRGRTDWMAEAAVTIPGPLTHRICALARETDLWLVPGSVYERADDTVYNTAVAVSPEGEIVARYRKVFPWQPYEQTTPGSEFVVFDLPGIGRAGLAICYDGSFPETARQLAWLGAEVIIQPTLTTTRDREMELVCARANAWTNQVFVVNLNGAGPAAVGGSCIVDPEGLVRQQAGPGEEVLVDVLDLDAVTRVRAFGSTGLNRPWDQLGRYGDQVKLPMYAGAFERPSWLGTC